MTTTGPRLKRPVWDGNGERYHYATCSALQISPTQVALFASLKIIGRAVVDLAGGTDVVIFDDPAAIDVRKAMRLFRNELVTHPENGKSVLAVKYLAMGGFVPLGAKTAVGSPHPHAGTGFGLATALGYPPDHSQHSPHAAPDLYRFHELQQYVFDGAVFWIRSSELFPDGLLPGGWRLCNRPLSNAIRDGDDLLFALVAARDDEPKPCLSRWRRGETGWRPVEILPVEGAESSFEPTLIRDPADGALLLSARPRGKLAPEGEADSFWLFRSTDGGRTWHRTLSLPAMRAPSPVAVMELGGGPVMVANPFVPLGQDAKGRNIWPTRRRQTLSLWPIGPDRDRVGPPEPLLDAVLEFGPPRPLEVRNHCNLWSVDHPTGGSYRLRDGQWRDLVCFRVTETAVAAAAEPPDPAGSWVETVSGPAPPRAAWDF